jgi:hypothetical protein
VNHETACPLGCEGTPTSLGRKNRADVFRCERCSMTFEILRHPRHLPENRNSASASEMRTSEESQGAQGVTTA